MPEKANARGNALDREEIFPHRKVADFRQVSNGNSKVKESNQRER